MKKPSRLLLAALASMTLAACNQGNPAESSDTIASGSVITESVSSVPGESETSVSSAAPTSDVFNIYNCADLIASHANKYVANEWTAASLVEAAGKLAALASSGNADSETKVSETDVLLLLYAAFKDIMPEKIGARSFQSFDYDLTRLKLTGFTTADPLYKAVEWFTGLGLLTTRSTYALSMTKSLTKTYVLRYLNRIHAYIGTSEVDDFFSAVNHDYLYDDNPHQTDPSSGQVDYDYDGDGDVDEDDRVTLSDSRLIPESNINQWAKSLYDKVPNAKAFDNTYLDQTQRVKGVSSGLTAAVNRYLQANTVKDIINVLKEDLVNYGWCPLWGDYQVGNYTYTSGRNATLLIATSYNYSGGDINPGSTAYKDSVERFAPIFKDVMNFNDGDAQTWGTNYTHFKYVFSKTKSLDDDTNLVPKKGTTYGSEGFDLYQFLQDAGVTDPSSFLFNSKNDTECILNMLTEENLPYVKGMFLWQMLQHYTTCLPNEEAVMAWAYRKGYGNDVRTLSLDPQYYTYCVTPLAQILSNYYTKTEEFLADATPAIELFGDLGDAMSARIAGEDWLSADGKAKAKSKIDDLVYAIGGLNSDGTTNEYANMPTLKSIADGGTHFGNVSALEAADFKNVAPTLGNDWSKDTFFSYAKAINPLTANAFYQPAKNGLDITLGYMAAYPRMSTMSEEQILASFGAVVGHELSHGFDSNGVNYDNHGEYNTEWFSAADKSAYSARVKAMISIYDGYEVMPGQETNGKTVQTETIADLNGMKLCMDIAKGTKDFNYDTFFRAHATNFGFYASQYTYGTYYATDEHPVGRARVNPLDMCLDEFHETYGTKEGDMMYLAPESRVTIW